MSQQIQITGGAKVRNLEGVLTGTSGVVNSLGINVPSGIPQLDGSGKILVSQLPNSVMEYKGSWNAATNTPTLADGTGNAGDVYLCNVAGTVNFGSGPIAFFVGDQVIYSGTIWQRASGATGTVSSVAVTESGDALTITGSPITTSGTINIGFAGTSGQYVNGAGGLTTFPNTLSSVGLTMPSAFSVANSPLTANGTIAVTGAGLASQYIRGNGTLANFPTSSGGGNSVSYYFNGSVNQGNINGSVYYEISKTPILGTGTDFSISNNDLIAQFITDANDPSLLEIPAGNWNFEMYFSASSNGGNPSFYLELYKYNAVGGFTLISSSSATPEGITNGTTIDLYTTALAVPITVLSETDRLMIRVFVNNSGKTITLHTEGSHLCQVITTFTTGLTALNGLTKQVQNFAVGTSGTDFNIVSTGSTHTFNIPNAGSGNRGLITSGAQTIAGAKSFGDLLTAAYVTINGVLTLNSNLSNGTYNYTLPAANGQLALTSQIPAISGTAYQVPRYNLAGTNFENSSILDTGTPTGSPSGQVIINSRLTVNNYAEVNRYLSVIQNVDSSWALPSSGVSIEAFITSLSSSVLISDTAYLRPRKGSDDTFKRFVIQGDDLILNDTTSRKTLINKAGFTQSTTKLEVAGYARFDSNVNVNGILYFNATDASQPTYLQNLSGDVKLLTSGQITLAANNANDFVFDDGVLYLKAEDGRVIGGTAAGRFIASNSDITAYLTIHGSSYPSPNKIDLATNSSINFYTGASYSQVMSILSNGRVGIGTTTATQKLQIGDGTATGEQYVRIFNSASDIYLGQTASDIFGAGNGQAITTGPTYTSNFAIGTTNASANLIFGTNNIERLRIASNGVASFSSNVGIGTNTPISKLHVNLGTNENVHIGTLTAAPTGRALIIETNANGGLIQTYSSITSGYVNTIINPEQGANVGIGTSTPSSKLHIIGSSNALIIASYHNKNLLTTYRNNTTNDLGYIGNGASVFSGGDQDYFAIGSPNTILFATYGSESMRLTPEGTLLIGTTVGDPYTKLQVSGNASFTGTISSNNIYINNPSGGPAFVKINRPSTSSSSAISFSTNGTDNWFLGTYALGTNLNDFLLYNYNTGIVSISFSASTNAATFASSVTANGDISITKDNPKLILNDNAGGSQNNYSISSNFGFFNLNDETASGTSVMSYGGGLFNFIGAATFSSSVSTTELKLNNISTLIHVSSYNVIRDTDANNAIILGNSATPQNFYSNTDHIFRNRSGATEYMRITSAGNVGIGTSSPALKLDVNSGGTSGNSFSAVFSDNTTNKNAIAFSHSNNNSRIYATYLAATGSDQDLSFWTTLSNGNQFERMRITSGGNVGIGTSSPNYPLHIYKTSNARLGIEGTTNFAATQYLNSGGSFYMGIDDSAGANFTGTAYGRFLYSSNAYPMCFFTDGTERMRITSGGSVLIGKTSTTFSAVGTHLINNGQATFTVASDAILYLNRTGSDGIIQYFYKDTSVVGSISVTASATAFNTSSDYRLKEDLEEINGLNKLSAIKVYDFKWKADGTRMDGVIAHELAEVIPYAVTGEKDGQEMQQVDYSKLVPILIKSIQELEARIKQLENK